MSYDPTYRNSSGDDQDHATENARELVDAKLASAIRSAVVDTLNRNLSMLEVSYVQGSEGNPAPVYDKGDVEKMLHASAANLAMVLTELVRQ